MRTNLGQAEDRKRTCEGPHRQKVQFYQFGGFQIVSYQLNYVSKCPPTHRGVYLDHLEQFRTSFKTFEKIPQSIPCFPDCFLLA